MSDGNNKGRKRSAFAKIAGIIGGLLLAVFIAAAVLIGCAIWKMKTDDVMTYTLEEALDIEPDPGFPHLSFTEDGIMTQSYSDLDLTWFIAKQLKNEAFDPADHLPKIVGLTMDRGAVAIKDGYAQAVIEAAYKGIRLILRVNCQVSFEPGGQVLTGRLKAVEVLGAEIPVSFLDSILRTGLSDTEITYQIENVLLKEVDSITMSEGALSFSGPVDTDLFENHAMDETRIRIMRLTQKSEDLASPLMDSDSEDPAERLSPIIDRLVGEPDLFVEMMDQLFVASTATFTRQLGLTYKNNGLAQRWFTVYDELGYIDLRQSLYDEYYVMYRFLKSMTTKMSGAYTAGRFRNGENGMTYNGAPFDPESFFGRDYKLLRPFFSFEEGKLCEVLKSNNQGKRLGAILPGTDGFGHLVIFRDSNTFEIVPLPEEQYEMYMRETGQIVIDLG